ncbi:hypothetical protein [Flavobacterium granuli]|uniref:Uncharacterized protein n=1 Tax=Flavobacterium granuli TaxID=280093 RepID=A0ABU1S5V3_9FLAO|nr:hypothetical protein [Flavobacterium granuli]MDR6846030.1 hypothetical protein [Flavobacterium granuli]
MRNSLITLIAIAQSAFLFSQTKKHTYYNNDSNNELIEISESQYLSLKKELSHPLIYEDDSLKVSYLIKMEVTSKLKESTLDYFKKTYDLDKNNFTVINYIDNDPKPTSISSQVPWDIFEDDYIKQIRKIDKVNHLWIINPDVRNLYYYHGNKIGWIKDAENYIQKNFLFFDGLNGGYIILDSSGNYFLHRGEYRKKEVLDKLKELKRKPFKSQ